MADQKNLPKPDPELQKPQTDLPTPEKEISSKSTTIKTGFLKSSKLKWILLIIILLIVALILAGLSGNKYLNKNKIIVTDFESCAAAGNPVMESYPEQCAADGKSFTRILSEEEKERLDIVEASDWSEYSSELPDTSNWTTYEDEKYTFKYPGEWNIESENNDSVIFTYSEVINGPLGNPQTYSSEFTVFSTPTDIKNLKEWLRIRQNYPEDTPVPDWWYTNIIYNGENALYVNCGGCNAGVFNEGIVFLHDEYGYDISVDGNRAINKSDLDGILSTFQFTDQEEEIDTSDWNTYKENDFSFKAPYGLGISYYYDDKDDLNFLQYTNDITNESFEINIYDNEYFNNNSSLDIIDNTNLENTKKINSMIWKIYRTNFDTYTGCSDNPPCPDDTLLYITSGKGNTYVLTKYKNNISEDLFTEILSTFKLTE